MALNYTTQCDNPECEANDEPLRLPDENEEGYRPPAGWLWAEVELVEEDEDLSVTVLVEACGAGCLAPAVAAAFAREDRLRTNERV